MKLTKDAWIDIYKDKVSPRDLEILDKAYDVLESNTVCNAQYPWGERPVVLPWIKNNFSGIWNWDSAFHGLTVSRFDTDLAKTVSKFFLNIKSPTVSFPTLYSQMETSRIDAPSLPLWHTPPLKYINETAISIF